MADDHRSRTPSDTDEATLALRHYLEPLMVFLKDPNVSEVCVNRPFEVWTEGRAVWKRHEVQSLTYTYCIQLATLMATSVKQRVNEVENMLSATLPDGERVQVVIPPSVPQGTVSITIRTAPPIVNKTLAEYEQEAYFSDTKSVTPPLTENERRLIAQRDSMSLADFYSEAQRANCMWLTTISPEEVELMRMRDEGRWREFFAYAVRSHQNIIISGGTGSGKTTFTRTLVNDIEREARIITIEDTPELQLPDHPNNVHLFYSKDGQGLSNATPQSLLASCMRMKPDRILLAELRGAETALYIKGLNTGHPGSITTVHSNSPDEAFDRLTDLYRENKGSDAQPDEIILRKIVRAVHVICQVHKDGKSGKRHMTEVFYDPRCRIAGVIPSQYRFGA